MITDIMSQMLYMEPIHADAFIQSDFHRIEEIHVLISCIPFEPMTLALLAQCITVTERYLNAITQTHSQTLANLIRVAFALGFSLCMCVCVCVCVP